MELKLITKTREEAKELLYLLASRNDCMIISVEEIYRHDTTSYEITFTANIKIPVQKNNFLDGKSTNELYDDLAEVL